jgi:hypothetical protein
MVKGKRVGRGGGRGGGRRAFRVGQAVRVATQHDGTVLAEITAVDGHIFVVRTAAGKAYRVLEAEIL